MSAFEWAVKEFVVVIEESGREKALLKVNEQNFRRHNVRGLGGRGEKNEK